MRQRGIIFMLHFIPGEGAVGNDWIEGLAVRLAGLESVKKRNLYPSPDVHPELYILGSGG